MRFTRRKLFAGFAALPFLRRKDAAERKRVIDSCNASVPYVPYPGQFEGDAEEWRRAMAARPIYIPIECISLAEYESRWPEKVAAGGFRVSSMR